MYADHHEGNANNKIIRKFEVVVDEDVVDAVAEDMAVVVISTEATITTTTSKTRITPTTTNRILTIPLLRTIKRTADIARRAECAITQVTSATIQPKIIATMLTSRIEWEEIPRAAPPDYYGRSLL